MRLPRVVLIALATLAAGACDGCAGCGSSDVLATLDRTQGLVEADTADPPVTFVRADAGRAFRLGEAIRTAADARADLTLAGGGVLHVEPHSLVRFSATPGARQRARIGVEVGGAEVEAPSETDITFTTAFGGATVSGGSRVRVSGGDGAHFEVVMGSAVVDGDGGVVTLTAGDRFVIQMGGAVLERRGRVRPGDAGQALDAGLPAFAADAGSDMIEEAVHTSVPEDSGITDFSIPAGETASIHDPSAPTAVRFRFGAACTTGGTVEVARRGASFARPLRATGRASATLTVSNGSHAYRVRCGSGAPFATGTLRVSRDAGTAMLPRRAPQTTVDADGRNYTVLYQTLLPIITLRWRSAPTAPGYIIAIHNGAGRTDETRTTTSSKAFAAGRFTDGTYTFTFRTADGRVRTAPTSLRIDFDNATPAAHLDTPPSSPVAGGTTIEGTAGEGAVVSVGGHALPLDRNGRFSGRASPASAERCVAIRVAQPQRGVHYFLRCGRAE